jgi:ferric iron reductase protein FhuF
MDNVLTDIEIQALEKLRLKRKLESATNMGDLLNQDNMAEFLNKLMGSIGAPTVKIAASIFMKRYAFLAVVSLYSMTVWNKKLNVTFPNVEIKEIVQDQEWLPSFTLKDLSVQIGNEENRAKWREGVFQDLFANHLSVLIDHLREVTNISEAVLWENIAVYLFWLYESVLKDVDNKNVLNDFQFLFSEANGGLFGAYQQNPLQRFNTEKTFVEEFQEEVRIRKTCCFSYQLKVNGHRCKVCPCRHISKNRR